jgi:tRNA threonylcarbamoyladenosine biosynthesis protein TsaB
MYFLSLETSTDIFSLSISHDERLLRFRNLKAENLLEKTILPAIAKTLKDARLTFEQLDAFAVSLGPGSFTSLRVGLSTVKAFAMATGKPLVGISSLDVIAAGIQEKDYDEVCVISDARRGNVYAAIYPRKGPSTGCLLLTVEDLLKQTRGRTLFTGNAVPLYRKTIEEYYKSQGHARGEASQPPFASERFWLPNAKHLAKLAFERLRIKDYDQSQGVVPIYLYPQDCQVHKTR